MILISIHPFGLPKLLLAIVAFLCFSALCFADPVLMVRRYPSSQMEQLTTRHVSVSSAQEHAGDGRVDVVDPFLVNFGSIKLLARQLGSASNGGGTRGMGLAVSSSVFRNVSCAMRSTGAPASIHHRGNLPDPASLLAL
jgi:hypothetical protein